MIGWHEFFVAMTLGIFIVGAAYASDRHDQANRARNAKRARDARLIRASVWRVK